METVDAENQEFRWTALMEQSLEGDCASYGELLSSITPALRRAIRTRARQVGLDAEDVVQEVLARAASQTEYLGARHTRRAMAGGDRAQQDSRRASAARRRPEVSIDSVVETLRDEGDVSEDQSQALERGIAGLPERQRQVLHAVSLEGYSAQEAAAQLQMSEVGVRVTLHRALKSLAVFFSQGNS